MCEMLLAEWPGYRNRRLHVESLYRQVIGEPRSGLTQLLSLGGRGELLDELRRRVAAGRIAVPPAFEDVPARSPDGRAARREALRTAPYPRSGSAARGGGTARAEADGAVVHARAPERVSAHRVAQEAERSGERGERGAAAGASEGAAESGESIGSGESNETSRAGRASRASRGDEELEDPFDREITEPWSREASGERAAGESATAWRVASLAGGLAGDPRGEGLATACSRLAMLVMLMAALGGLSMIVAAMATAGSGCGRGLGERPLADRGEGRPRT